MSEVAATTLANPLGGIGLALKKIGNRAELERKLWPQVRHSTFTTRHSIHLYLSPHLDDAVLSCGGQIGQLVRAGNTVRVVTVFAGDVPADAAASPFVQELHTRWGLGLNPSAGRRAEDRAALGILGARVTHLPFPDCVYRLGGKGVPQYPTRDAIFGAVAQVEMPLIDEVVRALKRLRVPRDAQVILPLTAGHHVDHQIVRAAGEQWCKMQAAGRRMQIAYYEDYPYAEQPDEVTAALDQATLESELVQLHEDALAAKVTAIACYHSQISSFFADKAEMAARVRAYAQVVGGGQPAERLWVSLW
jgi:LmbE family N-acetylglucosaminyl deacetylase